MTSTDTEPTTDPRLEPDRVVIWPLHLSITREWRSGAQHNIHMIENGDLGVILKRGQEPTPRNEIPHALPDTGLVVVSLGVDGNDHDEVHYSFRCAVSEVEGLTRAIDALTACRDAARQIGNLS